MTSADCRPSRIAPNGLRGRQCISHLPSALYDVPSLSDRLVPYPLKDPLRRKAVSPRVNMLDLSSFDLGPLKDETKVSKLEYANKVMTKPNNHTRFRAIREM